MSTGPCWLGPCCCADALRARVCVCVCAPLFWAQELDLSRSGVTGSALPALLNAVHSMRVLKLRGCEVR
jgi:hypothetical protein